MKKALSILLGFAVSLGLGAAGWAQSQTLPVCTVYTDTVPPSCPSTVGMGVGTYGIHV